MCQATPLWLYVLAALGILYLLSVVVLIAIADIIVVRISDE